MRALLPLAAVLVAACGGGSGEKTAIRLVVADKNIREEGVECSVARPYQHVHRGARFRIEDGTGAVVASGELPAGHAENAEPGIDWGVERIPTFCVLDFDVELPERPRYRLRLDRGRPLEFVVEGEPVELVVA